MRERKYDMTNEELKQLQELLVKYSTMIEANYEDNEGSWYGSKMDIALARDTASTIPAYWRWSEGELEIATRVKERLVADAA